MPGAGILTTFMLVVPYDAMTVRAWLVERTYDDKGLVRLTYATPDGERAVRKERSVRLLERRPSTAAVDVDADALEPVAAADRERYRAEAARMRERHDPDEAV
ncbi:MAG: hypothetical protein ABEJ70_06225 [Halobacteriaceae archaeon]